MMRASTIGVALLSWASVAAAQPASPTLTGLLQRFSEVEGMEAEFSEEKRVALLVNPVRSEGRIFFAADPDRLMRRVTAPDPSSALIAGGRLRMRSGERVEDIDIEGNPVLRGFVDSFRAVLAGNQRDLERFYDAALVARPDAGDDAWELRLRPRHADLRRFLASITMRGHGVTIEEMVMVEVNGDRTRTTFRNVNTARRFSPAEAARVFRI